MLSLLTKKPSICRVALPSSVLRMALCWVDHNLTDLECCLHVRQRFNIGVDCYVDYECVDRDQTRQQLHVYWCEQSAVKNTLTKAKLSASLSVVVETPWHALARSLYERNNWPENRLLQLIILENQSLSLSMHRNNSLCFFERMDLGKLSLSHVWHRLQLSCALQSRHPADVRCVYGSNVLALVEDEIETVVLEKVMW